MSNKRIDKYDQYIKGNMSEEEMDQFTEDIVTEHYEEEALKAELRKEVAFHYERMEKELQNPNISTPTNKEITPTSNTTVSGGQVVSMNNRSRILQVLSLGIAATLLVGLIGYFMLPNLTNTPSIVEAKIAEHYTNINVTRSIVKGVPQAILEKREQAFGHYKNKNYQAAIPLFKEILTSPSGNEEDQYFLGLSYLHNKQEVEAAGIFKTLLQENKTPRKDEVSWCLSLALLSAGKCTQATPYLTDMTQWDGNKRMRTYAQNAQELLDLVAKEGCPSK